jgi:Domain of unknown function (DUF4279)
MANEFHYSVSLSILHPSIDPKTITATITELQPSIETMAGSDRRDTEGNLISPRRQSKYTHWLADLHPEHTVFSGEVPLSDFILRVLTALEQHRSFFHELAELGEISFIVALFSKTNHSAEVLYSDTLKRCADLGIDIELDFYCPCEG